jgi:hypothetical protein
MQWTSLPKRRSDRIVVLFVGGFAVASLVHGTPTPFDWRSTDHAAAFPEWRVRVVRDLGITGAAATSIVAGIRSVPPERTSPQRFFVLLAGSSFA